MKLTFLGAAHEVTGSRTLLTAAGRQILIDYGMEQGVDLYENPTLPLAAGEIDCVLLTHAHIDHSGMIPALVKQGFHGAIYATEATTKLCGIMLLDSAHIQESEAQWRNRKAQRSGADPVEPIYTVADAQAALRLFRPCTYGPTYPILNGISISFQDAGHLLGSASITVTVTEGEKTETLLFSGDLGNVDRPLIRDPQLPKGADYVMIESTYGDRLHGPRADYTGQLTRILQETLDRGGNLVIPAFSVGRTQELLFLLREIKQQGRIKGHDGFPVYVDSPLSVEATNIYSGGMMEYYDQETLDLLAAGIDPIHFPGLRTSITSQDSMNINLDPEPKVILSASGMCEAGRIRHHLKHNLWRPQSTILFVGYQSEGTLGRKLLNGASSVKLFGEEIQVNAKIEQMDGISGHADQSMLLKWLSAMTYKPKKVFVNHGDDTVTDTFAALIREKLSMDAEAPYNGSAFDLEAMQWVSMGFRTKVEKRKVSVRTNAVFQRLYQAGRRLLNVIEKNRGLANRELAKFADQVTALCDKWDR